MNRVRANLINVFSIFDRVFSFLRSPFLLAVRLYWGWQFAQTGWGKLHHLSKVAEFFTSLHIPFPAANALFNGCLEFFGGILFAIGLASRPISLLLSISMMVAYITADRDALHSVFSDPGKFYNADPYTFLFAALLILIFGPGRIALDSLIDRFFGWKEGGD
jgi:putative oxidoreductase